MRVLANAYDTDGLSEEENLKENHHNAEQIIDLMWKHIEPFVIEYNGHMVFEYGMVKSTFYGMKGADL